VTAPGNLTEAPGVFNKQKRMLRIGIVRWRGKCSRHPSFDPCDAPGATPPACERCAKLSEILAHHTRMLELMKSFVQPRERKRPMSDADRQISLFEDF